MRYDINEYINMILMENKSFLIVEGQDDIRFYSRIINECNKDIAVIPIELIEGYNEGCEQIIQCIQNIQYTISNHEKIKDHLLGVIDRDMRSLRSEDKYIQQMNCLFTLKYYSFESHFVNTSKIANIISDITRIENKNIDNRVTDFLTEGLLEKYQKLYFIGLEACKNSIDPNYNGKLGFSNTPGNIINQWMNKDFEKLNKEELIKFAEHNDIDFSKYKNIIKGKWLLRIYSNHIMSKINKLTEACMNKEIQQCIYCKSGKSNNCLWKEKTTLNIDVFENILLNNYNFEELEYIIERISLLK